MTAGPHSVPARTAAEAQAVISRLSDALWALSAVSAAAETGALSDLGGAAHPLGPLLADVLLELGLAERSGGGVRAAEGLRALAGEDDRYLIAELRATLLQAADLAARARAGALTPGWNTEDPVGLVAQGVTSSRAVPYLEHHLIPALDGAAERLGRPGAAFLDVGAGVAAVSIEMCRRYPHLSVVGLEPAAGPLAIARQAVEDAGLAGRIELRRQLVEDLDSEEAFDLVWLPGNFLPPAAVKVALERGLRALRPGGWLLTATMARGGDGLGAAVSRLRIGLWGGNDLTADEVEAHLVAAGYSEVRRPAFPGNLQPLAARRTPA